MPWSSQAALRPARPKHGRQAALRPLAPRQVLRGAGRQLLKSQHYCRILMQPNICDNVKQCWKRHAASTTALPVVDALWREGAPWCMEALRRARALSRIRGKHFQDSLKWIQSFPSPLAALSSANPLANLGSELGKRHSSRRTQHGSRRTQRDRGCWLLYVLCPTAVLVLYAQLPCLCGACSKSAV